MGAPISSSGQSAPFLTHLRRYSRSQRVWVPIIAVPSMQAATSENRSASVSAFFQAFCCFFVRPQPMQTPRISSQTSMQGDGIFLCLPKSIFPTSY